MQYSKVSRGTASKKTIIYHRCYSIWRWNSKWHCFLYGCYLKHRSSLLRRDHHSPRWRTTNALLLPLNEHIYTALLESWRKCMCWDLSMLWWSLEAVLDDGSLRGGQMNGANACGQRLLQIMQRVMAAVLHWSVIEQLFKWFKLYENCHVLQKVALDVGRQLRCLQELREKERKEHTENLKSVS